MELYGCLLIKTEVSEWSYDRKTGTLASKVYLSTASKEKGTAIKTVFLDKKNREWLLTKDGLLCIEGNNGKQTPFL